MRSLDKLRLTSKARSNRQIKEFSEKKNNLFEEQFQKFNLNENPGWPIPAVRTDVIQLIVESSKFYSRCCLNVGVLTSGVLNNSLAHKTTPIYPDLSEIAIGPSSASKDGRRSVTSVRKPILLVSFFRSIRW